MRAIGNRTNLIPDLLDRDVSLLHFNRRILDMAYQPDVPLLERLRYLCIVSANLDEFFEVRIERYIQETMDSLRLTGETPKDFKSIMDMAQDIVARQYELNNTELIALFIKQGIVLLSNNDRQQERHAGIRKFVARYFATQVKPLLVPVSLDPSHPFPQVANKSLNFIIKLKGKDALGRENMVAIIKVPRVLPRVIAIPKHYTDGKADYFVLLSSVIRSHLSDLFPGRKVDHFSQFRITRNSDLALEDEDVINLRVALRKGLEHRQFGRPVRVEVSNNCHESFSQLLLTQFNLPPEALFKVNGPVNLVRLSQFVDKIKSPDLLHKKYAAQWPQDWPRRKSIFDVLKKNDVLLHHPYEDFSAVIRFLKESVEDANTYSIKMTIYRTGVQSILMDLLKEALRRGKEVTLVLELKARFDEEANINWAEELERVGAQVVYGVVGLKTHAKMLIVTKREGRSLKRYAHLSTGNYNPRTAALYTDIGMLTADNVLTADMDQLFLYIANQTSVLNLRKLWVAPLNLSNKLIGLINQAARQAKKGEPCRVIAKMNSLTDEELVHALILAGQAGVYIDLIVRGACILPAGLAGYCERIRVVSVTGRFLEHSRVFYFNLNGQEKLYLSSADWMNRNMHRRVELAWPVSNSMHMRRIIDECLLAPLEDQSKVWQLGANGVYHRNNKDSAQTLQDIQQLLMQKYSGLP